MRIKKLVATLLTCCMVSMGLTACGSSDTNGDEGQKNPNPTTSTENTENNNDTGTTPVTIEFFGWGDNSEQRNYQVLVEMFMNENPDVVVVYTAESASTYMTTLKNRANRLPDIFYMPDYDFLEWAANGMLKDITSYVSEEESSQVWAQAMDEYYFNPDTMQLGKSEGANLYGLPKDLGPFTLVYNKTLLDQQIAKYGLDSDAIYAKLSQTTPMTWQEFRELLKMIDPDGGADDIYGVSHYEIEAAVYSNNANFFNEDATKQTITDPNFYEAIQFIADLTLVDGVMPTAQNQIATNGYQRFKAQGCVFSFMGPWDCADFWRTVDFEYDLLPVPYNGENPEAQSTAWVGSMGYCISADCNEAKTEAAMRLAEFLCYNEDSQRTFYSLGQQVPNLVEMANNEYLNDTMGELSEKDPDSRSVWLDAINGTSETDIINGKVRARYYTYSSDWYTMLTEYFSAAQMWDGEVTAQKCCEDFAPTLQTALDEMQANLR